METHTFGAYHFAPHAVYASVQEASQQQYDYVVVTTKALPDITDDSDLIKDVVTPSRSSIVLIQNGVGVEESHRARFPNTPILSAVTVISAAQVSQGKIVQNRWTRISIGPYVRSAAHSSSSQDDSHLERISTASTARLVSLLKAGGIKDAESYDEKGLQLVRWHKIAVRLYHSFPQPEYSDVRRLFRYVRSSRLSNFTRFR
jgi:2-dehydropantoate 2-reductase